jgi:hypothetical protein
MEIRIDTARDSKEDIRRVIRFLQEIVEGEHTGELPAGDNIMGNIFDMPATTAAGTEATPTVQEKPTPKEKEKPRVEGLEFY